MQSPTVPRYLVPPRSKYSPQRGGGTFPCILNLALRQICELVLSLLPGRFTAGKCQHTYLIGGLVELTVILDAVERQKHLPLPGIETRFVDLHRKL